MSGIFNCPIEHRTGLLTRDEYEKRCALSSYGQVLGLIQSPEYQRFLLETCGSSSHSRKHSKAQVAYRYVIAAICASVVVCVSTAGVLSSRSFMGWLPLASKLGRNVEALPDVLYGRTHGKIADDLRLHGAEQFLEEPNVDTSGSEMADFANTCVKTPFKFLFLGQCWDRDEELARVWTKCHELEALNKQMHLRNKLNERVIGGMILIFLSAMLLCLICASSRINPPETAKKPSTAAATQNGRQRIDGDGSVDTKVCKFWKLLCDPKAQGAAEDMHLTELEQFLVLREKVRAIWAMETQINELEAYLESTPLDVLLERNRKLIEQMALADVAFSNRMRKQNGRTEAQEKENSSEILCKS